MTTPPRPHTEAFEITGMSCAHCVSAVRSALSGVSGAEVREVEVGRAVVEAAPGTTRAALADAIEAAGFDVADGR